MSSHLPQSTAWQDSWSQRNAERRLPSVADGTINGIPRVNPSARFPAWKRGMQKLVATRAGARIHRVIAAPLDAPLMRASGGRVSLAAGAVPIVVLRSTGARSGQERETPLAYFTDGDDVILTASNYGDARYPGWYHNLLAQPQCELRIGSRGGRFVAREAQGAERDRLFALAVELYPGYASYAARINGARKIPMLRLRPSS